MRRVLYLLIILFCGIFVSAEGKVFKLNDFCSFEGNLEKKMPVGEGSLYLGNIKSKNVSVSIKGIFNGDLISDAILTLNKTHFHGNLTYTISESKSDSEIEVKFHFENGYFLPVNSFNTKWQNDNVNRINVTADDIVSLSFIFNKKNQVLSVKFTPAFFNYSCKSFPYLINPIEKFIESNQWYARWDDEVKYGIKDQSSQAYIFSKDFNLYTEIQQSSLVNDLVISYKYKEIENGSYSFRPSFLKPYYYSDDKFYLKLTDGSELKRLNSKTFELRLPNGKIYTGDFINFPQSGSNIWRGLADALELTSTTLSFNNGTLTHPDGRSETIVNGERKSNELETKLKSTGVISLLSFQNIVETHKVVSDYASEGGDNFDELKKVSKGLLSYIGKPDMDELDLKLYYDSDQYKKDLEEYKKVMSQPYYSYEKLRNLKFTTKGLSFKPDDFGFGDETFRDDLKVIRISNGSKQVWFPFKKQYSEWPANFVINVDNFELLKLLKERQDHLGVMVTFTPGRVFGTEIVVKPTGLYLYDNEANVILADISFTLDKYSESALAQRYEKAEKAREAELHKKLPYHTQPKRVMCIGCFGKGYLEDYSWGEYKINRCPFCYGKGYEDTHYYE